MSQGELILTDKLKEMSWQSPEERQSDPSSFGGNDQVIIYGRPFWRIRFIYDQLNDASYRALTAWLARRKGSRVTFTSPRLDRRRPLLAPSLTNTGLSVVSVNISAGTVTIGGVGTTQISAGDMVSFYTAASGYWIGEATANAAPSGGQVVIPVHPYPQTPHATLAAPRLYEPLGEFKLAGQPQNTSRHTKRASVAFEAIQVVR